MSMLEKLMNFADVKLIADELHRRLKRMIDDTAGTGDTDKAWSADKLVDEFGEKADKDDVDVASIAETQTIIDEWEEEGMVVEMTFVYDGTAQDPCDFVSVFDADDIIEAYQAGKKVVVHIPTVTSEESHGNAVPSNEYWTIDAYTSRAGVEPETRVYYLSCGGIGSYEFDIGQDGKLHYTPYIG